MKLFNYLLLSFCFLSFTFAPPKGTIYLQINNVRNAKGNIALQLLDGQQKVLKQIYVTAQKGTVNYQFTDLPNGFYAIQIYHDENNNQKIDFGVFGAPTEGYAFSNNARGFMSAPKFAAQLFELKQTTGQNIKLIY
ncbi:MAG: hypothetical protein RL757_2898 [Bacteroidota bacterium]|jgi:uncharacterized protein (DUF2141 family)